MVENVSAECATTPSTRGHVVLATPRHTSRPPRQSSASPMRSIGTAHPLMSCMSQGTKPKSLSVSAPIPPAPAGRERGSGTNRGDGATPSDAATGAAPLPMDFSRPSLLPRLLTVAEVHGTVVLPARDRHALHYAVYTGVLAEDTPDNLMIGAQVRYTFGISEGTFGIDYLYSQRPNGNMWRGCGYYRESLAH
jgi:hypothetical protein